MKRDLVLLTQRVEKKIGKKVNAHALHKLVGVIKGKEKLSQSTLDHLALLVGFQSWADFHEALHGEDDGLSYKV